METLEKTKAQKQIINPWTWQDQYGYVQAVNVSKSQQVLYCAGQTSIDAEGNPIHEGNMRAQINQVLDNLETVLSAAGYSLSDVVRLNCYTTDVDLFFAEFDTVLSRLQQAGAKVSSTLLGVTRLTLPQLLIEIEATAVK